MKCLDREWLRQVFGKATCCSTAFGKARRMGVLPTYSIALVEEKVSQCTALFQQTRELWFFADKPLDLEARAGRRTHGNKS